MKGLLQELVANESGLILSAEMVLILTIAVIGIIVGLVQVQTAVVSEFQDLALAFYSLNQSFVTPAFFGCFKLFGPTSFTARSGFINVFHGCVGPGAIGGGFGGVGGGWGGGFGGGGFGGGYGGGGYGGYAEYGMPGSYCEIMTAPSATTPCENCPTDPAATPGTSPTPTLSPTPAPPPASKP